MNKYFVVFRLPLETMDKWRSETPPEKMKEMGDKMMADMNAWMDKHKDAFLDRGMPLGKTKTVTASGIADSRNDLNYCLAVQTDSHDAAAALFADCPHLQIPTSQIDVMEVPHMGM